MQLERHYGRDGQATDCNMARLSPSRAKGEARVRSETGVPAHRKSNFPRDTARAVSSENVEAFKRGVEAANRSDAEAFLKLLHPDVEWHTVLPMVGGDAVYRGIDEVRRSLVSLWDVLAGTHFEFPDIRDLGDRLIAIGRIRVTGDASGAAADSPFAFVIKFRGGKVYLIRSYLDPNKALQAAGLSERAMPGATANVVGRVMDAYNRRDVEALLVDLDPDIEWHPLLPVLLGGEATVYRGHEGVRAGITDLDDAFSELRAEVSEVRERDAEIVAIGRLHGRGKASGATTESPLTWVFEFRSGKVVRVREYVDPDEALDADWSGD